MSTEAIETLNCERRGSPIEHIKEKDALLLNLACFGMLGTKIANQSRKCPLTLDVDVQLPRWILNLEFTFQSPPRLLLDHKPNLHTIRSLSLLFSLYVSVNTQPSKAAFSPGSQHDLSSLGSLCFALWPRQCNLQELSRHEV